MFNEWPTRTRLRGIIVKCCKRILLYHSWHPQGIDMMKIIISLFLCTVMVIAYPESTSTKANSSQLQTKIINGILSKNGEYKYMASLQIDGKHICSSGIFKPDLLLTTGLCAWHIENAMEKESKKCTAIVGDSNLKNGQRIDILRVVKHPRFKINNYAILNKHFNLGVVMLKDKLNNTFAEPLDVYEEKESQNININDPIVCGWGETSRDDFEKNDVLNAEYSDNLYCIPVILYSRHVCGNAILLGDFKVSLMCGKPGYPKQNITLGDVGSPLIITVVTNGEEKAYISGITLHPYHTDHSIFLRFIRGSRLRNDLQKIMKKLQPEKATEANCDSSNKQDIINKPRKRPKFYELHSQ